MSHRGPTLGYRLGGRCSPAYLPDHEPALGTSLDATPRDWVSGFGLASRTSVLIHDAQYTEREYQTHVGWGHSSTTDALQYARRTEADKIMLTHHDPSHDTLASTRWPPRPASSGSSFRAARSRWSWPVREPC